MKTNLTMNNVQQKPIRLAIVIAISFLMIHSACFADKAKNTSNRGNGNRKINKPLTEQIRGYIQVDDTHFGSLNKGVVVVSFLVDETNRLRQVVSHSQITSLDNYLKSSLEGKAVQPSEQGTAPTEVQFIKLRISIEK